MSQTPGETTLILRRLPLGGDSVLGELISRTSDRLREYSRERMKAFPRLKNLESTDDVLNSAVIRLMRALRRTHPETKTHYFNLAKLQIRRVLKDLVRRYEGRFGGRPGQLTNQDGGEGPGSPLELTGGS